MWYILQYSDIKCDNDNLPFSIWDKKLVTILSRYFSGPRRWRYYIYKSWGSGSSISSESGSGHGFGSNPDPAFHVNPDPDTDSEPIQIQSFDDQKLKNKKYI
jgi:hypothetical protein